MLTLDSVRVRYGPLEALHGVSLTFAEGEVTAVLGRNGAGKTSLLRAAAGLIGTSGGRIVWRDTDLTRAPIGRRAACGILLVPDENGVFRSLTVRENLELFASGDHRHSASGDHRRRAAVTSSAIDPALETFPALKNLIRRRASHLSGGEQRMLALSRALLTPWQLLLVDELSHGLAPTLARHLYEVLAALAATHPDRAIALAEPDHRRALDLAHRIHVLRRGELASTGIADNFDPATL